MREGLILFLFLTVVSSVILRACGYTSDTTTTRTEQKTECEEFAERVARNSGGSKYALTEACEKEEQNRLWESNYEEALRRSREKN